MRTLIAVCALLCGWAARDLAAQSPGRTFGFTATHSVGSSTSAHQPPCGSLCSPRDVPRHSPCRPSRSSSQFPLRTRDRWGLQYHFHVVPLAMMRDNPTQPPRGAASDGPSPPHRRVPRPSALASSPRVSEDGSAGTSCAWRPTGPRGLCASAPRCSPRTDPSELRVRDGCRPANVLARPRSCRGRLPETPPVERRARRGQPGAELPHAVPRRADLLTGFLREHPRTGASPVMGPVPAPSALRRSSARGSARGRRPLPDGA